GARTSSLLPYTTLFRSADHEPRPPRSLRRRHGSRLVYSSGRLLCCDRTVYPLGAVSSDGARHSKRVVEADRIAAAEHVIVVAHGDRKSTRLNSSHVKNS